ncbi:MAG: ATP-dependent DNA helicase RecG [Phycicoccus sp.]|nr:ATP-dependent DNA helicase RecG [Phycicoccus sp.]
MAVTPQTLLWKVIGKPAAKKFETGRGIVTVGDLLGFWPRRYRTREADLGGAPEKSYLVSVAEVKSVSTRQMKTRKGKMLTATITDGRHDIVVTFFNAFGHEGKLVPGARGIFAGVVSVFRNERQLAHPGYTLLDDFDKGHVHGLIPVYLRIGKMHTWTVTEFVRLTMAVLDDLPDPIPAALLQRRGLPDRLTALRGIHTPERMAQVEAGRRRLRYEEALLLQLVLAQRRARQAREVTVARAPRAGGIRDAFDARLPFVLTQGQQEIGATIDTELGAPTPMHRLLQGEVGSGKTVVALRAMLAVVDAGGQAALLAPTEVLAQQHHRSLTRMLGDLAEGGLLGGSHVGTQIGLLTGSVTGSERKRVLQDIEDGTAGIVVGTHALLQEGVTFADLGLVVIDEQHRFGVEQRDALRAKGNTPPHVLVMTATPIPRTVAMTVFGDLETSTLRELPAGRMPITTHLVHEAWSGWIDRTWARVAEEVRQGRQAFVVCPRIGGDGDEDVELAPVDVQDEDLEALDDAPAAAPERPLHDVVEVLAELRGRPEMHGLRIEALHGRMSNDEKDAVMQAFAGGEIDVLVSTTVIEVGVDVPNASVMVILDADRFGVSQLHQLRGRVGRGGLPGLALLMTASEAETARERLEAVTASIDGFELARLDLRQRREGDILGGAQHGRQTQLEFLHVLDHEDVIADAREDAFAMVARDPDLRQTPLLAAAVEQRLDAEQAAYLERG